MSNFEKIPIGGRTNEDKIANPCIGDTINARHLNVRDRCRYVYCACPKCNKTRWTRIKSNATLCRRCSSIANNLNRKRGDSKQYYPNARNIAAHPKEGDRLPGHYVGITNPSSACHLHQYAICSCCGTGRWIHVYNGKRKGTPPALFCADCRKGENTPTWRGGTMIQQGYVIIRIPIDSMFFSMTVKKSDSSSWGYAFLHRIIMALSLGRCLESWEVVHHIDRNRLNNELSNLELVSYVSHLARTRVQQEMEKLRIKITELESLNKLNSWRICQLEKELSQINGRVQNGYNR